MTQITVISVGTLKEDYLKEGVLEYKKRLSQFARVDEINIKEERIHNESDTAEIASALMREGEKILGAIPKDSYRIALCIEGRQFSSEELAKKLLDACDTRGRITLIIGSSHGMSQAVKDACEFKLSFSKMTFPHQLMRVMLFEALYRSFAINANKSYHK